MDIDGRTSTIFGTRICAAVDCITRIEGNAFVCPWHRYGLPAANRQELLDTFDEWKQATGPRTKYLAARIRAILALAALEGKTPPASLARVLEKLDSGEWNFAI